MACRLLITDGDVIASDSQWYPFEEFHWYVDVVLLVPVSPLVARKLLLAQNLLK
jgi:hypothetical protein